jgi:hypothetical protein
MLESKEARRILRSPRGTTPWSAQASQTAISTSNHFWVLFWGDQMRPISGRVYRSIIYRYSSRGGEKMSMATEGSRTVTW